ncbi:MAG TPA: DUF4250 domain-containing protein [Acholeplasmataceae bacterium]|nr:DUF4250 domain-containing protein [Acholeplasmataceae bacterium]
MNLLKMDVNLLVSIVNTKLRDHYSSLDELCDDLDLNKTELINKLKAGNYFYNENLNQFK